MQWNKDVTNKIENKTAIIGVMGLGYVGLPLAIEFSKKFLVVGFENDNEKISHLNNEKICIDNDLKKIMNGKNLTVTNDFSNIKECDFIILCVPTPLKEDKNPDLSFIIESAEIVSKNMRKKQIIVLESTTYPGTTTEVLLPILEEKSGLEVIKDFGIAYSPERVDPGNKKYNIRNTPKIVGSINKSFCDTVSLLYQSILEKVIKVSNCETAEAVKILENVFRNVNIALINELAIIFREMDIDIWETVEAAKTKPYGFMPFYPGPGIGGHCIPLDPYYIAYRAKQFGLISRFIQTAGEINDFMPIHIVNLVQDGLDEANKNIRESKIAIFGLAYKPNIEDTRESPSIKIIEELKKRNAEVRVFDPVAKHVNTKFGRFYSDGNLEELIKWSDCIIFATAHTIFKDNIEKYIDIVHKKEGDTIVVDSINIINKRYFIHINKNIILKSL